MIINVHERRIAAAPAAVWDLLETLGQPGDRAWRTRLNEPMVLDAPLAAGGRGGHGAVRYRVTGYEPGRRTELTFEPPTGLRGTHTFEVEASPDGTATLLRHRIDAHAEGSMRLLWPLLIRPAHDTVVEDVFDHVETTLTGAARRGQAVPWRIRALLPIARPRRRVVRRDVARDGLLAGALPRVDAGDAWATPVEHADTRDVAAWQHAAVGTAPAWVSALMGLRDRFVRPLGLRTAAASDQRGFPVLATASDEVLVGLDDRHLDFRVSIRVADAEVVVTTVVQVHNALGRLYWGVVRRVHPAVVRSMIAQVPRPLDAVPAVTAGSTERAAAATR